MENFYEKPLAELTNEEWEQICMRCGKCCLCKYSDNGFIHFSNQVCRYFNLTKGTCSCYDNRLEINKKDCRKVDLELLEHNLSLLPPECAYRRLYEGRGLPKYHPLLTGKKIPVKYTVASLPVFSETAIDEARNAIYRQCFREKLTPKEILEKQEEVNRKYALKWLETYPETIKPTV